MKRSRIFDLIPSIRKSIFILVLVFGYTSIFSQESEKLSYQLAVRDAEGNLRPEANVAVQLIVLQDSTSGDVVYIENHYVKTNSHGEVGFELGNGTVDFGAFRSIDWDNGSYFIKIRVDGVEVITSQVLSLPHIVYVNSDELNIIPFNENKTIRLVFSAGLNLMSFKIIPEQNTLSSKVDNFVPGITISIGCNLRLSKHFDFRLIPGLSFGQRTIQYYTPDANYGYPQRIESTFIDMPLILSYGYKINRIKPYALAGLNYRYDLAGKQEYDPDSPVYLRLKRSDLYYELGAGLGFEFAHNKLSIEIKMSNGIRNVLIHDSPDLLDGPYPIQPEYMNAIQSLRSQVWQLTFIFE